MLRYVSIEQAKCFIVCPTPYQAAQGKHSDSEIRISQSPRIVLCQFVAGALPTKVYRSHIDAKYDGDVRLELTHEVENR